MQKMVIAKKGQRWYLRYRTPELAENGKRKEVWEPIAPVDSRYKSKRDVEPLARDIFSRVSVTVAQPNASQRLADFIEFKYFPGITERKRPSTVFGYKHIFNKHIKSRLGDIRLFDFDAATGQKLLRTIAEESGLSHTSLKHVKHFMAGVITFAIQEGDLKLPANPIQLIETPKGEEASKDTYAYDLDEIAKMMEILPEPANTVVAAAAFTGLRRSELRGLRWEDLDVDGGQLHVRRTVWNTSIEDKTKTKSSRAPVPLVPMLQQALEAHRDVPAGGFIFAGERMGRPLNLANLARRVIAPTLRENGIKWVGWHGFRRGLATNLYGIRTPENIIQDILRHADIKVTRTFYIKPSTATSQPAMQKLVKAFEKIRKNARKNARKEVSQKVRKPV